MRIAIGSDHRGLQLKQQISALLKESGYEYHDYGVYTPERADYPGIARLVGEAVATGNFERGILICGTGIGMCIAANKVHGIRAAVAYNILTACRMRQHNDANILCLGGENDQSNLEDIVKNFLNCEFQGGRYQDRVNMLKNMENV